MSFIKKFIICVIFFLSFQNNLYAGSAYYLDFKLILNESDAGKKAQVFLKKKLEDGIKNLKEKEKKLQNQEKKIIEKKKVLSAEEYRKQVNQLRVEVSSLQKERNLLLETVSKQRSKARSELLKNLNPLIKEYMKENNIRLVLDKKSLLLADENLDITDKIKIRLNKKLKSIKLN